MKALNHLILVLTLAVAFAGCGKSLPKLTPEQKEQFGEVLASAGQAQRAVPKGQSRAQVSQISTVPQSSVLNILGVSSTLKSSSVTPNLPPSSSTGSSGSAPSLNRPNESAMRSRLETSQCEIKSNMGEGFGGGFSGGSSGMPSSGMSSDMPSGMPTGAPSAGMPSMELTKLNFDIHVTGANCPVAMDLALKIQAQQTSADADFVWSYTVKDAEYRKLNDVTGADLKGGLKITGDSQGRSGDGDLSIKGTIVSQKHGELPVELTGKMHMGNASGQPRQSGEIALFIQFKDFGAELKQKMDGDKIQHFINSEEVTEKEFNDFVGKMFN